MAGSVLATLTTAGIIERVRNRQTLRVTPRFLAHAQATAHRGSTTPHAAIQEALATWECGHPPQHAADVVASIMDQHGLGVTPLMRAVAA